MSSVIEHLRPRSLRQRVILGYAALVFVLFGILSLVTYGIQANTLDKQVQTSIQTEAGVVRAALHRQMTGNGLASPLTIPEIDAYTAPGITVEIVDCANALRYTSPDVGAGQRLPFPALSCRQAADTTSVVRVEGQRIQVDAEPIRTANGQIIGFMHIAHSLAESDAALRTLRWALAGATLAAVGLAVLMGWFVARQVLHPLATMAQTARAITAAVRDKGGDGGDVLQRRVPIPHEVDEVRTLAEDINHMLDAVEEHDTRQRQFITDASHELRTPLTTIRGNLELVRRAPDLDPAEQSQAIQHASTEAEHMAELVADLLALARIEHGPLPQSHHEAVDIDAILVEVFQLALERAKTMEPPVPAIRLETLEPVQVWGDAAQLRQALLILIDNAFKYAPQGMITLQEQCAGEVVQVMVSDTGPGIAQRDLPHIFDRFYRANRARDREGSGLGLAIAQAIIRSHQGQITAASVMGQGASFMIQLPRYQPITR